MALLIVLRAFSADNMREAYNKVVACKEKDRLLAEYGSAARTFSESVDQLQRGTKSSSEDEYGQLFILADSMRLKSEQAGLALDRHLAEHGC